MIPSDVSARLRELTGQGGTVFLAMGNIFLGDDGFGPELAAALAAGGHRTVDAGTVPENHIGAVARMKPSTVIILDAVHLGREPGAMELLERGDILEGAGFSTHTLSPVLVMEWLEAETGAEVLMLAVQPSTLKMGAPLSPGVSTAIEEVTRILGDARA